MMNDGDLLGSTISLKHRYDTSFIKDPMGSEIHSQKLQRDPRYDGKLYPGIRLDNGSYSVCSRKTFWDHESDFGIHA